MIEVEYSYRYVTAKIKMEDRIKRMEDRIKRKWKIELKGWKIELKGKSKIDRTS